MGKKYLMSGSEAMAEAAIRAGCPYLFEIRDKRKYNLRKRKRWFIIKGLA